MSMQQIILYLFITIIFITIFSLIGCKLDKKNIRRKQKRILKRKGYSFDIEYIGSHLTKYDLYLDSQNKKLLYFNKKFTVYNYQDVTNIKIEEKVTDGRYTYSASFSIKNQEYKVVLKNNINEKNKIKYEELVNVLRTIETENKQRELEFEKEQAKLQKEREKEQVTNSSKKSQKKTTNQKTKNTPKNTTSKKKSDKKTTEPKKTNKKQTPKTNSGKTKNNQSKSVKK